MAPKASPMTITPRHPLHTQDFVDNLNRTTPGGYAAHMERRTGRTTAIALQAISKAIRHPGKPIYCEDHHAGSQAARHMTSLIRDTIARLNLQGIEVSQKGDRVELLFGKPTKTLAQQMSAKFSGTTASRLTAHQIDAEAAQLTRALADQKDAQAAREIREALEVLSSYRRQCPDFSPPRYVYASTPTTHMMEIPTADRLAKTLSAYTGCEVNQALCDRILEDFKGVRVAKSMLPRGNDEYGEWLDLAANTLSQLSGRFAPIRGRGFWIDEITTTFDPVAGARTFNMDIKLSQRPCGVEFVTIPAALKHINIGKARRNPPIKFTSIKSQGGITLRAQTEKGGRQISAQAILLAPGTTPAAIRATYRSLRDSVRRTAEAYPE